jgi:hypothetical protein
VSEWPRIVDIADSALVRLDDGTTANLFEQGALAFKVEMKSGDHPIVVVVNRDVFEALPEAKRDGRVLLWATSLYRSGGSAAWWPNR